MYPDVSMKCSLTIKKIPHWINTERTIKVRQVDNEEADEASVLGLTVFRDSIYENKQASRKKKASNAKEKYKPKKVIEDYDSDDDDESNFDSDYTEKYDDCDGDDGDDDANSDSDYIEKYDDCHDNVTSSSKSGKKSVFLNQQDIYCHSDDDKDKDPDYNVNFYCQSDDDKDKDSDYDVNFYCQSDDDRDKDPDYNVNNRYSDNNSEFNNSFNIKNTTKRTKMNVSDSDSKSSNSFNIKNSIKTTKKSVINKSHIGKVSVSSFKKKKKKNPVKYFKYKTCKFKLNKLNNHPENSGINKITKRKNGRNYFLIPLIKKYETSDEMEQRHRRILEKAWNAYEKVVNNVDEETKLMNLELASYKIPRKKISENSVCSQLNSDCHSDHNLFQYLCPFHFCSDLYEDPKKHLEKYHNIITKEEDIKLYIKSARKIKYVKPC